MSLREAGLSCVVVLLQGTGHGWSVPLASMVVSVPLWAIIVTQMCSNWTFYTLLTSLPTYMSQVLHFDLQSVGSSRYYHIIDAAASV